MDFASIIYFLIVIGVCAWLYHQILGRWDKLDLKRKIIYCVGLGLLVFSIYPVTVWIGGLTLKAEVEQSYFLGKEGETLLATTIVGQGNDEPDSYRIETMDLVSGKVLARSVQSMPANFLANFDNKLWFVDKENGLNVRDSKTLKMLANQKMLESKDIRLKRGINTNYFYLDDKAEQMVVTTQDGYNFAIDNYSYQISEVKQDKLKELIKVGTRQSDFDYSTDGVVMDDKQKVYFENTVPRNEILRFIDGKAFFEDRSISFVAGQFIQDSFSGEVLQPDGPKSFMVISKDSLADDKLTMFTRVSQAGELVWQKKLLTLKQFEYVKQMRLIGDNLIVVTDYRVLAFAVKDGSEQWVLDF